MRVFKIAMLLFLSVHISVSHAQPVQLSFQNFTQKEGLSDNNIHSFYQDSRGYLWICTTEGLNRFDGFSFRKFYADGTKHSLPSNIVYQAVEYKPGFLLISTSNGLTKLDILSNTFEPVGDPRISSKYTGVVFQDSNGDIMLCYADGMLITDRSLVTKYFINTGRPVIQVHRLRSGELMIATNEGYYTVDTAARTLTLLRNQFKVTDFPKYLIFSYYDSVANLLYTSEWSRGLFIIDLTNKKVKRFNANAGCSNCLPTNNIYSAFRDSLNKIWIGTDVGIFVGNTSKLSSVYPAPGEPYGLVNGVVWKIYEDRSKNIWFGTAGGISRLNPKAQSIQHYKDEFLIKGKGADINGITRGIDNKLYVSTYGNGIFNIDEEKKIFENIGRELMPFTWSVVKDGSAIIATGHDKRMFIYQPEQKKAIHQDFLSPFYGRSNLLLFAFTHSSGDKWYSLNEGAGLVQYSASEKKFYHYTNKDVPAPFAENYFSNVKEDEEGNIWFAVNRSTNLVCWEKKTKSFKSINLEKIAGGNPANFAGITDILINGKEIWAATSGTGVILFHPDSMSIEVFSINQGLAGDVVNSLVLDNKKRLWAGTSKGLSCRLPGQKYFSSFAAADGLPEIYFNEFAHYYDSAKNRIYLGARNSVVIISPDDLLSNKGILMTAHLDGIKVNGEIFNYQEHENYKLRYFQNNLQFNFSVVDLNASSGINLFYRLDGADHDWINAAEQRTASYINLPAGTYHLRLRISKQGSGFSADSLPFSFTIAEAWWRTAWFRILMAVSALFVLYLFVRMYYRGKLEHQQMVFEKKQAVEQERTRIATDMHDDLGAGLTGIKFLSEDITEHSVSAVTKERLEKLKTSANSLIESMGEIIWAMNERNNTLGDLLFHLRSYSLTYCEENNLECHFNLPENIGEHIISGHTRRNIFLIIKESLHNIVKHSHASRVDIYVSVKKDVLFTVQDNGNGFHPGEIRGNGLINMQKRAREMKGGFSVTNKNEGTLVEIKIPLV